MRKFLVHVALQGSSPKRSSLEVLSYVSRIVAHDGDEVVACLFGSGSAEAASKVSSFGAHRIISVTDKMFDRHLNCELIAVLERVIGYIEPSHVFFASSESIKDVLGALAVRMGAAVLPDVVGFSIKQNVVEAVRPVMAAKSMARTEARADLVFISVRSGSFEAVECPAQFEIEELEFHLDSVPRQQKLIEIVSASDDTVDLAEARVVVAAGRGVKDAEGKKLVEDLASLFAGGIGASRAVVETNLFPAAAQIGQTGKVVSPDLYFALGISGAIQHVAGMSNSRVIVAINKDPDAPIFDYATYGVVGDLYKIVPLLIEEVKRRKQLG